MPWTPVSNVSAGSVLTASAFNDQVLGNLTDLRGDYATSRYTTANIVINSTTWTNLGGPADLTLAAEAGDVIEVALSAITQNEAVDLYLDCVTVVSGSPVNAFGNATTPSNSSLGIVAWLSWTSSFTSVGGSFFYKLVSGDVSGGNVVLRLRARTNTATNKIMFASTNNPVVFFARNHGQVEV